jgi:hypothetical protein
MRPIVSEASILQFNECASGGVFHLRLFKCENKK